MIRAKNLIIDIAIIVIAVSAGLILKAVYDGTTAADKYIDRPKQPVEKSTSYADQTSELNLELFNAANNGDLAQVKQLIEEGADVNSVNKTGITALMRASQQGHLDVAKFLVNNGADVNAAATGGLNGFTALMFASMNGHSDVVKFLVDKGADVNTHGPIGDTPLFIASSMGNLDLVKFLVAKGADVDDGVGSGFGFTPLMPASQGGYLEIVEFLVANGADVNAVDNIHGATALMSASKGGHLKIVEFLIDKGADVNAVTTGKLSGHTALIAASEGGHLDIVKLLIEKGADINAAADEEDLKGLTALMLAAREGHLDVVKFLIDKGADVNTGTIGEFVGGTALMFASGKGHLDVVKFLVENKADVNVVATDGEESSTALIIAAQEGYLDIVKFLVEKGADITFTDKNGKTARDYAIIKVKNKVSNYIETPLKYNPYTTKSYKSTFTYFAQAEDTTEINPQLHLVKGLLKKDVNGINDIGSYQQITKDSGTHLEITIDVEFDENKLIFSYGTDSQIEENNEPIHLNKKIFTEDATNTYAYLIFPEEWKLSESFQVIEAIKNSDGSNHSIMACPPENAEFSSLLRNYNALLEGSFWSRESDKSQSEKVVDTVGGANENGKIEQLQEKYKDYKIYKIPFYAPEGIIQDYSNIGRSSTIYFDKSSLTGNCKIFIEIPQIAFKRTASGAMKKAGLEGLAYELNLTAIKGNYKPEYQFVEESSGLKKKRIDLGDDINMEFVYIPSGEFMMGSLSNEGRRIYNESPQHHVKISKGFWMGVYEVTNGQYQQFVKESNYEGKRESNANYLRHLEYSWRDASSEYPVIWISWNNAQAFCEWLSVKEGKTYCLPTEAQWEYACRAGRTKELEVKDDGLFLNTFGGRAASTRSTHPAGQNQPNSYGLFDMYDNVREWCRDWYGSYSDSSEVDPEGPRSGDKRVVRGDYSGSIISYSYTERSSRSPSEPSREIGFRVVCEDSQ
jgi:ankyrin repeat protein/formylglycine-generating enzyme required for sulfatase activity